MEKQLLEIFEFSPDIHYYYNVSESRFTYINPAIKEHFGISPENVTGKDYTFLLDIVHPDDRDVIETYWANTANSSSLTNIDSCDFRCRTKIGKFFWFSDTQRYLRNSEGKIVSLIGCIRDITDLKVVEILKSSSKERLSLAMEAASDSIWEWKTTSNRLFFDARFYSILGYEPYEFQDNFQEWENQMHPDDRQHAFELLKNCAAGINEQIHLEYRIRTKKNNWKWILCRARVSARNDEGKIIKIIGTQTDITKLKEAEEEIRKHNTALREAEKTIYKNSQALQTLYTNLKENEERLQLFFDEAKNIAFLMFELKEERFILTEFSSGAEIIFDTVKAAVLHKEIDQIFSDTPNAHFSNLIHYLNKDGLDYKGEVSITKINGKSNACLLSVHFINKESENRKILMILTDIQERKEFEIALKYKNEELIAAEEELKATNDELKFVNEEIQQRNNQLHGINERLIESEEKFRELAENTNDAFWLRDEKELLYINPSFEKLWGRKKEQIFENPEQLEKLVHPEDRSRYTKWEDFQLFSTIINYSEQFRIIKDDGTIRWLWARIHPVFNNEGKIYRLAGIATDITELKETEIALLRAKEKAMESDNLKSAFLANISHEIRTPMNGVLGFLELLSDESLTVETRNQYINIIRRSSKQLLQLINDIIDISKIEANQLNLDIHECNINTITRDIFLFYQKDKLLLEKDNLELKIELPLNDEYAKIYTDESRLSQILMNIVDNAVKFSNQGQIVIGYRHADKKTIEFYIKDTGIGIPKDQYHLVFERFRQIDGSTTRKFGGTGLGLSISEGLVKLLGGSIWFESEPGVGTTFYVTLPYNPVNRRILEPDLIEESIADWGNKIILIVEDDEINFELMKTMLEPSNAIIIHAASGEDAIRIFSNNQSINLVLMDIRLPGINGYQAMRYIKDQNPSIPVIAQTAFAMSEDNQKCLEQGFDDYIAKPINRKLLYKIIQKQLNW